MELNKKTLRNIFLGVGGCIVLYWLLHDTERMQDTLKTIFGLISPFVVGAAIAFILNVPMRAIERRMLKIKNGGLRRGLAMVLTLIVILAVVAAVFCILIPQISQTIETLIPTIVNFFNNVQKKLWVFLDENPDIKEWLAENTNFSSINWSSLIQNAAGFLGDSLDMIASKAFSAIGTLSTGIFNAVMSLAFALYSLAKKEKLAAQGRKLLYAIFPEKIGDETVRILRLTNTTFSNFISGQCLEAVILGLLFVVAMAIFQMPYIPLICVIISVTALVPIVGAFVGCGIGAFFILVEDPALAVGFVIMFLVIQQLEGNLIYPKVVGSSIGLPGMWVLVAVSVGGDLMGPAGMLLMIPLASVVYALIIEFTYKRLDKRQIAPEKLEAQPPEVRSNLKDKGKQTREKWKVKLSRKKNK